MYPIKFCNLYYPKIWGGRDLELFRSNLPEGDIGESWDIACHPNGIGIVSNGQLKGKSFEEIIKTYDKKLLGNKFETNKFPLLVKLISSKDKLSVQVHPGDQYAQEHENDQGKTEAWYVIDAKPGASLILGVKDCNKQIFKKAIEEGTVKDYLNKCEVKKGDFFLINSGLVHGICEGVIIAEIQQNSDITYRVYDYGRQRELHVEKALDVINFGLKVEKIETEQLEENYYGYSKRLLCKNKYFSIERYLIKKSFEEESDVNRFFIFTCVEGNGIIQSNYGFEEEILKGESIFIPATLGKYRIEGNLILLKTYV